jgi:hypothetical protein
MTHDELGIRVEGKAGNERLASAITAYRSALEVYTREQLPQDWALTQNNLGLALSDQAARTEGAKGAELLAQAMSAYRSALEVTTREQLPPGLGPDPERPGYRALGPGDSDRGGQREPSFWPRR